jgi:hypothetical protein
METKTVVVTDNTSVTITKKRMNGLILRAAQDKLDTKKNMLDNILDNAGIEELTFEELVEKGKKSKCLERVKKILKEVSA